MDWLDTVTARLPVPTDMSRDDAPNVWARVETALGVAIPEDYKAFERRYGRVDLGDYVVFFHPSTTLQAVDFVEATRGFNKIYGDIRQDRDDPDWCLLPEPGGLLPFALANVDYFCWQTGEGAPETWPVVILEREGTPLIPVADSFSDFMVKLVSDGLGHIELVRAFWDPDTEFIAIRR